MNDNESEMEVVNEEIGIQQLEIVVVARLTKRLFYALRSRTHRLFGPSRDAAGKRHDQQDARRQDQQPGLPTKPVYQVVGIG